MFIVVLAFFGELRLLLRHQPDVPRSVGNEVNDGVTRLAGYEEGLSVADNLEGTLLILENLPKVGLMVDVGAPGFVLRVLLLLHGFLHIWGVGWEKHYTTSFLASFFQKPSLLSFSTG